VWGTLYRALFLLAPFFLLAEEQEFFEIKGKVLARRVRATVGIYDTASPFVQTTYVGLDGSFKFKKIPKGTYTLSVFLAQRGEIRRTLPVGPASADEYGRVTVEIRPTRGSIDPTAVNFVSIRSLSVTKDARKEYDKAVKSLSKRDVEGGIRHFQRAVEIAPQFAAAWNYLGTISYQSKRFEDAERHFRQAREADPEMYESLVNLGGVLVTLGKLEEAQTYNSAAVERRPNDPLAQVQLGLTYLRLRRDELAEKHLLAATRLDPRHFSNPQIYLAEIYLRQNDRLRAARQLSDLLRHHPDWPDADKVRETIALWTRQDGPSRP
jgi:tetratricopeptide (TPR) repeat protein